MSEGAAGMPKTTAQGQVATLAKKWEGGPKTINVVQSETDVPAGIRQDRMRGAYDPKTDTVWIVADNLDGEHDAAFVALHEVIGHRGIEAVLGKAADSFYTRLAHGRMKDIKAYAAAHGLAMETIKDRRHAAREWLADRVGNKEFESDTWYGKLIKMVRAAIERITGRTFTDAQLGELVRVAHGVTSVGGKAVRYSVGGKLRNHAVPVDDVAPEMLNVSQSNEEIVKAAAAVVQSWPAKVTAADGSEVLFVPS